MGRSRKFCCGAHEVGESLGIGVQVRLSPGDRNCREVSRSVSEYWGAVANRGLVSRAREERRTAMAPIGYGSRQRDSATTPLFPSGYGRSFVAQPGKVTKLGQQEAIYFVADT